MQYIDIHTHKRPSGETASSSCLACYNEMMGKEQEGFAECCSAGVHPWYIYDGGHEQLRLLRERAGAGERVRLIGEAGLDKMSEVPFDIQEKVFEEQIICSEELRKPLVVHCVKAWQELIAMHRRFRPSESWLVHGFRGKGDLARQLLREGLYLSFGEHFQPEAVKAAWKDRLLLETDESSLDIADIYQRVSQVLDCPLPVLQEQIAKNFAAFMGVGR